MPPTSHVYGGSVVVPWSSTTGLTVPLLDMYNSVTPWYVPNSSLPVSRYPNSEEKSIEHLYPTLSVLPPSYRGHVSGSIHYDPTPNPVTHLFFSSPVWTFH